MWGAWSLRRWLYGLAYCSIMLFLHMSLVMRISLDIDDRLLAQAKSLAAREQTSLTRVIEDSLSSHLKAVEMVKREPARVTLPVYNGRGGLQPLVKSPSTNRAMLDAADSDLSA